MRRSLPSTLVLAAVGLLLSACSSTPPAPRSVTNLPPVSGSVTSGAAATASGSTDPAAQARAQQSSAAAVAQLDPCPDTSTSPSASPAPTSPPSPRTAVAPPLPDHALPCLHAPGQPPRVVNLARLRGPAVINVWASWCGPCRQEAPLLEALHRQAGDRVTVLGVDYSDDDLDALAFAGRSGLTYPSVTAGPDDFPLARYNPGPPVTLFVDSAGRVVYVAHRPFTSQAELDAAVAQHLGVRVA